MSNDTNQLTPGQALLAILESLEATQKQVRATVKQVENIAARGDGLGADVEVRREGEETFFVVAGKQKVINRDGWIR